MSKNFINSHKKVIEITLLTGVVLGGIAAIIIAISPQLSLLFLKYTNASSPPLSPVDWMIGMLIKSLPAMPFVLFFSSVSAFFTPPGLTVKKINGSYVFGLLLCF